MSPTQNHCPGCHLCLFLRKDAWGLPEAGGIPAAGGDLAEAAPPAPGVEVSVKVPWIWMGCSPDVGSDNRPKGSLGARRQQEGACVPRGALNPLHRITIWSCSSASLTNCFIWRCNLLWTRGSCLSHPFLDLLHCPKVSLPAGLFPQYKAEVLQASWAQRLLSFCEKTPVPEWCLMELTLLAAFWVGGSLVLLCLCARTSPSTIWVE